MLRLRHNSQTYSVRFGDSCRTARYISVFNRNEFLFSVSNIKVNNSAAARRDATPSLFRQSVPVREHGTSRYVSASKSRNDFFIFLSLGYAAAMRDATPPLFRQSVPVRARGTFRYGSVHSGYRPGFSFSRFRLVDSAAALREATPPHFSSSNTHLSDTSCCNAAGFSDGSFQVSNTHLPARCTWPPGYPLSRAGRAPWLGLPSAGGRRPADIRISLPLRDRPRGASRKGPVDYAEPRPFLFFRLIDNTFWERAALNSNRGIALYFVDAAVPFLSFHLS